jgi:hypothetical protein
VTSEDLKLRVLQAVRLKGRTTPDALADTVDADAAAVTDAVAALAADGLLSTGRAVKLTDDGRARLSALLARERHGVDRDATASAYAAFRMRNADFKSVVSDWQLMHGQPNPHDATDHDNADHDDAVLGRLREVHAAVTPIIDAVAAHVPRIGWYGEKLRRALERIDAGDHAWVARPIVDSYHTVWFELHEELIGLAGLTRADEAEAGHA